MAGSVGDRREEDTDERPEARDDVFSPLILR
jgi:hypothetical protein